MGPFELLQKVVEVLERLQIPYIVTGSVASMAYGGPRLTNDIDIVASINEHHISGEKVDYDYISEWAERLGLVEIWKAVQRRLT